MTLQILPQINNLEFAKKNHEIHGIIESYQFSRLADLIVASSTNDSINDVKNEITYHLTGRLHEVAGEAAHFGLEMTLEGQLNLKCQRCLNAMPYAIDIKVQYIVLPNMKSGPHQFDSDDVNGDGDESDIETIPADEHMQVLDLIEDELLLNLPLAPMHNEKQRNAGLCVEMDATKEAGKLNPFEVLKALKK